MTAGDEHVTTGREHATAGDEHLTTGGEHAERDTTLAGAAQGDVRDNIPRSDRGGFNDIQDDMRNKASDASSRATGDEAEGGDLADKAKEKAKEKAKDPFGKARNRR